MQSGRKQRHLVVGGGGYPGWHLAMHLAQKGVDVCIFDIQRPASMPSCGITFLKGDVTDFDQMRAACRNIDCVYHLASFGMSGREQLNKKLIEKVNILGSENIIRACHCERVSRLVYTSTYNVVFGGKEIVNGDESLSYLPLREHVDHYSLTKAIAEMKILCANDCYGETGSVLRTCALRLAGIYGPGEQRHIPRIISYIRRGLFSFTYGGGNTLVDFLHVDNLVQAHLQAAESLTDAKYFVATGEAYFVSDNLPVNNFIFFKPLVEGLGYKFPRMSLPFSLVYYLAFIIEIGHCIVGNIYNFQPLLTRAEVYKTGITHYFNISKANRDLGYNPTVQNDMESVVRWYTEGGFNKAPCKSNWINTLFMCICIFAISVGLFFTWMPVVA